MASSSEIQYIATPDAYEAAIDITDGYFKSEGGPLDSLLRRHEALIKGEDYYRAIYHLAMYHFVVIGKSDPRSQRSRSHTMSIANATMRGYQSGEMISALMHKQPRTHLRRARNLSIYHDVPDDYTQVVNDAGGVETSRGIMFAYDALSTVAFEHVPLQAREKVGQWALQVVSKEYAMDFYRGAGLAIFNTNDYAVRHQAARVETADEASGSSSVN